MKVTIPISKSIQSNLPTDVPNSHPRKREQGRAVTNLSHKHVNAMVTPIRSDQVSIDYSMGGGFPKVTNPKFDCLNIWSVKNEALHILADVVNNRERAQVQLQLTCLSGTYTAVVLIPLALLP